MKTPDTKTHRHKKREDNICVFCQLSFVALHVAHYHKVYALDGFYQEGISHPLKVAWVIEDDITTGEQIEFWAITSMVTLTAYEMRELAHWRWDIEF